MEEAGLPQGTGPQAGSNGKHIRPKVHPDPSFQPAFFNDSVSYVKPDDRGLAGLLTRHIDTSARQWRHFVSIYRPFTRWWTGRSIFGLPIFDPYSLPARLWMGFMLAVDVVYTAFVVPVSVAFCTRRFATGTSCVQVDIVGGVIYLSNFLFMFQCGIVIVHKHTKLVLMDGLDVARAYALSWRCFLDVISFLPFIYMLIILGQQPKQSVTTSWVELFSIVRLLRMLRMLSISKMVAVDSASGKYKQLPVIGGCLSVPMMYLLLLLYIFAVLINLEACILVLSAYLHSRDVAVFWDTIHYEDVWEDSQAYQWYVAMYWAITTSTNTGYGDIVPQNRTEQVLANCMMILGVISSGLLIGAFANLLTRASAAAHSVYLERKKVQEVENWLKKRGLSLDPKLRAEVEAYFFEFWLAQRRGEGPEKSILSELPSSLRAKATERIVLPFFKRVPPLGHLPDRIQRSIARLLRPVQFFPGQNICVQGHEATCLWVIERGLIVALRHGGEQVQSIQQEMHDQGIGPPPAPVHLVHVPCLLAESVILEDIGMCKTHLWTYRALEHTQAWELHIRDLWPLLHIFPEIKVKVLLYVRDRLCRDLAGEIRADNDFCEISELIRPSLNVANLDPGKVEDLISDLLHADIVSGELAHVLSVLVEVCTVHPWLPTSMLLPDPSVHPRRFGGHHEQDEAGDSFSDLAEPIKGLKEHSGLWGGIETTSAPLQKKEEGTLPQLRYSMSLQQTKLQSVPRHHRVGSVPLKTVARDFLPLAPEDKRVRCGTPASLPSVPAVSAENAAPFPTPPSAHPVPDVVADSPSPASPDLSRAAAAAAAATALGQHPISDTIHEDHPIPSFPPNSIPCPPPPLDQSTPPPSHLQQPSTSKPCLACGHVTCPCCQRCLGVAAPSGAQQGGTELAQPFQTGNTPGPLDVAHRGLHELTDQQGAPTRTGHRQGALLSRLMLGAAGRGRPAGLNSRLHASSSLGRSSAAFGANPFDRYHSIGLASVPLQSDAMGPVQ